MKIRRQPNQVEVKKAARSDRSGRAVELAGLFAIEVCGYFMLLD
jgi:hypothetical protein